MGRLAGGGRHGNIARSNERRGEGNHETALNQAGG